MCLSRVDCFVGLNWFTNEWKLLAEEFWTAEKNFGFKQQKAKKLVYGQAALSLVSSGVVNTAIRRLEL